MRKLLLIPAFAAIVSAQTPTTGAPQSFEVATVKENKSGQQFIRIGGPQGRFTAENAPLALLIQFAYQVQPFQLESGPDWIRSDRFDVVAKTDGANDSIFPTPGQPTRVQLMMRTLLEERFRLTVHREMKEMPIYALVLARADGKVGPKLSVSSTDCDAVMKAARARGTPGPAPTTPDGRPLCGMRGFPGNMSAGGFPMSQLAQSLSGTLRRVVIDRTGLTGTYDFELTYTPDEMPRPAEGAAAPIALPAIDPNGPNLFTAIQEQLGLKLEAARGPVETLVIDHVEKPTGD